MSEHRQNRPLWTCPQCNRRFANQNQSHACGRYTLAEHLEGKSPEVLALYSRLEELVQSLGPVIVLPEKTRIAFQVRMSFAAIRVQQRWIDGHVVLARRLESPRFRLIESIPPRNHVHHFRIISPDEIDDEFAAWFTEAYQVDEVELGCLRKSITGHFHLKAVLSIASRFQSRYATSIVFPFLALLKFGMF